MDRHDGADERAPLLSDRPASASAVDGVQEDIHWRSELALLLKYSLPLIATYLLQYSFFVITIMIAGHLGADDLAAASIGATTMNVIGLSILEGMATALDTLCAQAYGSGHKIGVGLHIQRMIALMGLSLVPVGLIWIFSPWILPLFVKQHHLAVKAGVFLQYSLIGLPGYGAFEAGKRFLQAQGDCNVGMVVLIICAPVNAGLSYWLAFPMDMGLAGAALGSALSNNLRFILLFLYVMSPLGKWSHVCWGGLSRDALRNWGPMVSLSFAGVIVLIGEWAAFEILTFSTSYLSTGHLAAQTLLTTAIVVVWHIPFSISVALSTRVGHLIGGGYVDTARRAAALYFFVFFLVGLFNAALIYFFRYQIVSIFTKDPAIRELAVNSMWLAAVFEVIDSVVCGTNGLLRGLGKQSAAAYIAVSVNYLEAVPLAMWLELGSPALGIDGVWVGFGSGVALTIVLECLYVRLLDWQSVVDKVKCREDAND
ncbi:mate efflux family protein [Diaporthe amygdali]|uniref:mate efflux family protein n=1 Tax=Phomopsis amygdali TaxID=1214568 RepID=UPI0022FE85E4|nr:mate efflux family protein [Diaporthe amygdali]KAJ0123353.1 mate efflux family protein [Diaporthe amygdali]